VEPCNSGEVVRWNPGTLELWNGGILEKTTNMLIGDSDRNILYFIVVIK